MRGLQPIVSRSSEVNNSRLTSDRTHSPSSMLCSFRKNVAPYSSIRCRKKSDPRTPHGSLSLSASAVNRLSPNVKTATRLIFILVATTRQRMNETKHWPAKTSYEPKSGGYSLGYFPELKGEFTQWARDHQTRRKPQGLHAS